MKLITGVTIYTMNRQNDVITNGQILISEGKIKAVGQDVIAIASANDQAASFNPATIDTIDGKGAVVTPGLIDIHTHVGLWGETTGDFSDGNEASSPFTPLMSAADAINPQHISFKDARSGGVTTVQTGAGSGNPIGGIWSIVKTAGETVDEMIIRRESALKGALGENPKGLYGQLQKKSPYSRMATAKIIRQGFQDALAFLEQFDESVDLIETLYKQNKQQLYPFIKVLQNDFPLRLHAHRADDIATAIRIAKEFSVQLSIEHCTEGFKMIQTLKDSGYPVTLGPFMGAATKYETRHMNLESPKRLQEAGIPVSIITDHPFVPIQYLSLCAAESVRYGMDEMEALRAITINPAQLGGIDERVGSIEAGKDADIVMWSNHPFATKANVLSTWIEGEVVYSR